MSRPKLSLCMIVRDEEHNLSVCLESIREHVDEIIVIDTGSEDRTIEVAALFGAIVHRFDPTTHSDAFFRDTAEENAQWKGPGDYSGMWCLADFAGARNESFKHATGDYIVWMDADDVLVDAHELRNVVDALVREDDAVAYLPYNYAQDDKGRVFYRQWRERVIRRGAAQWFNAVHEVLIEASPPRRMPRFEKPLYAHRRKADRKMVPHRNYKILLRHLWQQQSVDPDAAIDPRTLFYLGQESRYVEPIRSVEFFEAYLHSSGWPEERAAAHSALAQIYESGRLPGMTPAQAVALAEREYAIAAVEQPENPDGFFGLARCASARERWIDCIRYTETAFALGNTDTMLGTSPIDRLYRPHVYYNFALNKVGRVEEALASARKGLAAMPEDPGVPGGAQGMLQLNVRVYEEHLRKTRGLLDTRATHGHPRPMPKLSLAMIVKNEEQNLPRCLESVAAHVDEIIIVDTGSTDATKAIAANFGAHIFDFTPETNPESFFVDDEKAGPPPHTNLPMLGDFGAARALSFAKATGDYILWLDADDVLEGAELLPALVAEMAAKRIDIAWFEYLYMQDPLGRVVCTLKRERVIRRGSMRWVNPIHEVLIPTSHNPVAFERTDIRVRHARNEDRTTGAAHRNYKVLLRHIDKGEDARTLFYFANEARTIDPDRAIAAYERYVEISGWNEERSMARCYLGELYEAKQQFGRATAHFSAAATDSALLPDGWFGLARLAYGRGDWPECIRLTEEGLKRGNPSIVIMMNPLARTYAPYVYYSVALNAVGRVKEAHDAALIGLKACPDDPILNFNLQKFRLFLDRQAVTDGSPVPGVLSPVAREAVVFALGQHGVDDQPAILSTDMLRQMALRLWKETIAQGETAKAWQLLESLPNSIAEEGEIEKARLRTAKLLPPRRAIAYVPFEVNTPTLQAVHRSLILGKSRQQTRILVVGSADGGYLANRIARDMRAEVVAVEDDPALVDLGKDVTKHLSVQWVRHLHDAEGPFDLIVTQEDVTPGMLHMLQQYKAPAIFSLPVELKSDAWNAPRSRVRWTPTTLHEELLSHSFEARDVRVEGDRLIAIAEPLGCAMTINDPLRIVIWAGPAVEQWDPESPKRGGIGGSETACIEVARHLVKLGHFVIVYSDCREREGFYEGVHYRRYQSFAGARCDVFISSRQPGVMDHEIDAKVKLLWVHDVHVGQPSPEMHRWLLKFDRILCLTEWHKAFFLQCYAPFVHEASVLVTRNGLDPARFVGDFVLAFSDGDDACFPDIKAVQQLPAKKNKLIYSSSANRGLDALLDLFPRIRAEVPDAELHVFYGFESWEAFARQGGNVAELQHIATLKKRLATTPGVVFRGRVHQDRLAQEMLESKVWAYPTAFTETYCCHPDTMISIPGDHRGGPPRVRIADLVGKTNFPVYAYDADEHRFRIATALRVWETKVAEELVALELDDGQVLRLTPDHLVMNFDGEWVEAGKIVEGDRLMALHHRYAVMIKDADGSWSDEHRLVGEWMAGRSLATDEHVDHLDPLRLDNRPEALQILSKSEHHSKTHRGSKRSKRAEAARFAGLQRWTEENPEAVSQRGMKNSNALWERINALSPEDRAAWLAARAEKKKRTTQEARQNHRVVAVRRIPGCAVYDMEVADLHNFVADGVVVHNCITAIEAQASACVPVTTALAALAETVKWGVLLPGSNQDPEYQTAFVNACVSLLKDEDKRSAVAAAGRQWALQLTWEALAAEWLALFNDLIEQGLFVPRFPQAASAAR